MMDFQINFINAKNLIVTLVFICSMVNAQQLDLQLIDENVDGDEAHFVDLDGDNDLDIMVVSTNTFEILWYENHGELNFEKHLIDNTSPIKPQSLDVIDFNNDTHLDLVIASNDDFLHLYTNNGNNEFADTILAGSGFISNEDYLYQPSRVKTADLNQDGITDFVVSNQETFGIPGEVYIYLSDSGNSYSLQIIDNEALTTYNHINDIKDVNNDGFLDIIYTDSSTLNHTAYLYLNDGLGNFAQEFSQEAGIFLGDSEVLDVNEDGYLDILVSTVALGLGVYINNGDNTFVLSQILPESEPSNAQFTFSRATKIVDWNNDNLPDVVVSLSSYGVNFDENIQIFTNQGNGSFSKEASVFFGSLSEINVFDVADLDNDGDIDIVALARTESEHFNIDDGLTGLFVIINNEVLSVKDYGLSKNQFRVFPNPVENILTIKGQVTNDKVIVYNALGQLIFSQKIDVEKNHNDLDVSALKSGIYFIKNGSNSLHFVKQ